MSEAFEFGGPIVWRPGREEIERAHLTAFMRRHAIPDWDGLMRRSTEDVAWFTEAVLEHLDIAFYEPYETVVDLSAGIMWPKWCVGGRMNIVHNCLDKWIGSAVEARPALVFEGEDGERRTLSYGQLHAEVNRCANALRSLGLGKGDAVGLYMPMTPEIVIALLAVAKIGGIILPLFSGYGVEACVSRLADAEAKAIVCSDGAWRRGKVGDMKATADAAAAEVGSIQHLVVLRRTGHAIPMQAGRDHWWHELVDPQSDQASTERTLAEDDLMVIYTSGTTGKPKGARHTHCGFPIKAAQDMAFGTDVHAGDLIYW
ncbi:MAG: AMP-binding protein, partial [Chloroflexi bacterium]|nr:AMP-binding protein [Chloroflexota bacterium]